MGLKHIRTKLYIGFDAFIKSCNMKSFSAFKRASCEDAEDRSMIAHCRSAAELLKEIYQALRFTLEKY
eukprot:scaffold274668_cov40-Prasinocladus_malaysianus.AAC.2